MGKGLKYAFLQRRHAHGQQVRKQVCSLADHQGHESKSQHRLTPVSMAVIKKRQSSRGKSLNKRELLVTMGGKLIHPLLTIVEKFLKNIESRTTIWSSNPTSGYISKGNEIDICTPVFIAASITTAKTRKQPVSTTSSYETILRDTELEDTVIILLAKCRGCEIQREHEVSYGI